jgi:hypothetical protein
MVLRSMPELLKHKRNRGKWAAYPGEERVAIRQSDVDAYQDCFRWGLKHEEFYVGWLKGDPEGIPPWGTFEGDWNFYEVTEDTPADAAAHHAADAHLAQATHPSPLPVVLRR